MSRALARVHEIPQDLCGRLAEKNIHTCRDVLGIYTPTELQELVDLQGHEMELLLEAVSRAVLPPMQTLDVQMETVRPRPRFLSTGIELLDRALGGGLAAGSITELVGGSGTGKTLLCCELALGCALPASGNPATALLIDTENGFSPLRLAERARERGLAGSDPESSEWLERIRVHHVGSAQELCEFLCGPLEVACIEYGVGLVVVDSLARLNRETAFARRNSGGASQLASEKHGVMQRNHTLLQEATALKLLSETLGIPVVVTNLVTGGAAGPALGNTWSHAVNTRLLLENTSRGSGDGRAPRAGQLTLVKSPLVPPSRLFCVLSGSGIEFPSGPF